MRALSTRGVRVNAQELYVPFFFLFVAHRVPSGGAFICSALYDYVCIRILVAGRQAVACSALSVCVCCGRGLKVEI